MKYKCWVCHDIDIYRQMKDNAIKISDFNEVKLLTFRIERLKNHDCNGKIPIRNDSAGND